MFVDGVGARAGGALNGDRDVRGCSRLRGGSGRPPVRRSAQRSPGQGSGRWSGSSPAVAALRPWEEAGPDPALLAARATGFAAAVLEKRLRRVRRAGRGFKHLAPEALHTLRKEGKRLRYAAEAFAPLFPGAPTRRFLKRLRAVQGTLGEMQDAAVARDLLARLGSAGRGYAGGLAVGLAEGHGAALRAEARAAWRRFGKAEAFWIAR